MLTEAQKKAQRVYNAKIMKFLIKLNPDVDQDIIDFLATKDNRQGYIKSLIRKAMESEQQ